MQVQFATENARAAVDTVAAMSEAQKTLSQQLKDLPESKIEVFH